MVGFPRGRPARREVPDEEHPDPRYRPRIRDCMCGGKKFKSAGIHNRLCPNCNGRASSMISPMEPL